MELILSVIALVVSVGTALSALAWGGLEGRRQHIREVERFYLTRYWQLLDQLPMDALLGQEPPEIHHNARPDECESEIDKAQRLAVLYLRMCDDEVHARAQGQVSDVTWHEWLKAMHTQIRRPPVKQVWASVLRETPEDAYADLRRALADDGNGGYKDTDPCHWRRFTRYWRGLSHTPILLWGAKGRPRGPMRRPENHDKDHWQP